MASFDIIEASGKGYRLVWQERGYLARLAFIPVLVKLICYTVAVVMGWETQFIRFSLAMLPSYLADGWMLAHLVRLIFLGQRWPFRPGPDPEADAFNLAERALGVSRGIAVFALTRLLLAGIVSYGYERLSAPYLAHPQEPPPPHFVLFAPVLLLATLWGFRLIWLHIPAALNYPLRAFMRDIRGFSTSLHMVAVWLISMLPPILLYIFIVSLLMSPVRDAAHLPSLIEFTLNIVHVVLDTIITLIATASVSYGMIQMIGRAAAPKS
jgi:hypothetical protein